MRGRAPLRDFLFVCLLFSGLAAAQAGDRPGAAAVASAHPLATRAALQILREGGNAFDAAITASAVLAVVEPYSSGLGGGGFWLLHRAADGFEVMLDGRERAPLAARADMYLDDEGEVIPGLSIDGALAAGIPGQPAALVHLAEHYGRLPLAQTLQSAVRLAREGFPVDAHFRRLATWRLDTLRRSPAASSQFLVDGDVPPLGYRLRQPDLARTMALLGEEGREGFYAGPVAQRLVAAVRSQGGIWTLEDLTAYRVMEREPVRGDYGALRIVSASPPSSGGVALVCMLNILSALDLAGQPKARRAHLLVEAMRRAYRDRARYLGDPDFVAIPLQRLTHPYYAEGLARDVDSLRATPSRPAGDPDRGEARDTTHFSILDREGNRVAATLSINYPFGSGLVAAGTGVLINDEMDDFSARPGAPNVYGLTGGAANAVAPGKRMLSSMTPTFVESEEGVAILGTPGGSRIISMVLHGVLALAEGGGEGPADWVARPRFHHQYLPDVIEYEPGALSAEDLALLEQMGHRLRELEQPYGNMQVVYWDRRSGEVLAASDPRGIGSAEVR